MTKKAEKNFCFFPKKCQSVDKWPIQRFSFKLKLLLYLIFVTKFYWHQRCKCNKKIYGCILKANLS